MTTYKGNSGVAKIASNTIAELTSWSLTEVMGTVEDTAIGDTARTFVNDGLQAWSAQVSGHYYPGDTNGQALIIAGASLSFDFSPAGSTSGLQKFTGTGLITSVQYGDVANASIVPFTAAIQGAGALTRGTNS